MSTRLFPNPLAHAAGGVDLGKAEVADGGERDGCEGVIGQDVAAGDALKEPSHLFSVHGPPLDASTAYLSVCENAKYAYDCIGYK